MTGAELKAIRKRLGLTTLAFGRALGYQGDDVSVAHAVRRFESSKGRKILPTMAKLIWMYGEFGVPEEMPD